MASRETEHVQAGASDTGGEVAPRVEDVAARETFSSEVDSEPEEMAEGPCWGAYEALQHVGLWSGIIVLVWLASSCVDEARASEPPRIWTPAELSQWAARLEADKAPAKPKDCVDEKGIDRACLQTLWFGYDLTTVHKAGGGQ